MKWLTISKFQYNLWHKQMEKVCIFQPLIIVNSKGQEYITLTSCVLVTYSTRHQLPITRLVASNWKEKFAKFTGYQK